MSSTSGLKTGAVLHEIARLRLLNRRKVREAYEQRKRAEFWKARALGYSQSTARPLCECHGEPMHRQAYGRGWRCSVKQEDRAA